MSGFRLLHRQRPALESTLTKRSYVCRPVAQTVMIFPEMQTPRLGLLFLTVLLQVSGLKAQSPQQTQTKKEVAEQKPNSAPEKRPLTEEEKSALNRLRQNADKLENQGRYFEEEQEQ